MTDSSIVPSTVHGHSRSAALLERGKLVTPGGINSPRRRIDPPLCPRSGAGAYIQDVDGNYYLDMHAAYGAIVLGHAFPQVDERVIEAMGAGILFGVGTTELEVEAASRLVEVIPSAEQALLYNTGSEATFHAIRLARAATGRNLIVKFQGLYHGHHDYVSSNNLSAPDRVGLRDPFSAGMLPAAVDATLICRFNDLDSVRATFEHAGEDIAAIIVEPIPHNSPNLMPQPGFHEGLRAICNEYGALLIWDEVLTGFRHHVGGYQAIAGITPDISTWGKAIANGVTAAALTGPRHLLELFQTAPGGTVWNAGTHNGNATAAAAMLAVIDVLQRERVHEHTFRLGDRMRAGLAEIARHLDVPAIVSGFGSLYTLLFMQGPLLSYDDVLRNDAEFFVAYRRQLVARGLLEMPENVGRNHISYSHTVEDIDRALSISYDALKATVAARGMPRLA